MEFQKNHEWDMGRITEVVILRWNHPYCLDDLALSKQRRGTEAKQYYCALSVLDAEPLGCIGSPKGLCQIFEYCQFFNFIWRSRGDFPRKIFGGEGRYRRRQFVRR